MKNFVSPGDALDLVAPSGGVTSGKGVKIGAIIAIAMVTVAAGATFSGLVRGVINADSDTGTAWAVGDIVYWDDTAKVFTKTTTSNTKAGYVTAAKASGATSGQIRLQPVF
jgi:predicted RecA/RadA family phage recombinase